MKNKVIIFTLLLTFFGCGKKEEPQFFLCEKPTIALNKMQTAYIDSQNDRFSDIRSRKEDHWAALIYSDVRFVLRENGFSPFAKQESADLIVKATVRDGKGFPKFGRHWDIITNYIDHVNIKLIDGKTGKTVGEIEYNRPSLTDNPPRLIRGMMETLMQSAPKKTQ